MCFNLGYYGVMEAITDITAPAALDYDLEQLPLLMALEPFERAFLERYVLDCSRNAARAYRELKPNVARTTAKTEASKLLAKPNLSAAKKELEQYLVSHGQAVFGPRILAGLAEMAFKGRYVMEDGDPNEPCLPGAETWLAVPCKPADKLAAMRELAKMVGLVSDKLELSGGLTMGNATAYSAAAEELMAELRAQKGGAIGEAGGQESNKQISCEGVISPALDVKSEC